MVTLGPCQSRHFERVLLYSSLSHAPPQEGMGTMGMIRYFQACATCKYTNRITLDVMGIQRIPAEVLSYTRLTAMSFVGNGMKEIPSEIGFFRYLKNFNLRGNKLAQLPESFGNLESLTSLDVSYNEFAQFPPYICKLTSLTSLNAAHCKLIALHDMMGQMGRLETLELHHNAILDLPTALAKMPSLRILDVRYNKLSEMRSYHDCPKLSVRCISYHHHRDHRVYLGIVAFLCGFIFVVVFSVD